MSFRISLLSLMLVLSACASTPPRNVANVCDMFEDRRSWFQAAQLTQERWAVPVGVSMAFLYQESGFRPRVRPPRNRILWVIPGPRPSDAYGYAQALESTWDEYREQTGNYWARRSNFEDAVDFVGWYNANSYRRNGIASHDARNLYLAYHEGNTGFERRTYESKQWLIAAAEQVQLNADRYQRQYEECADELGHSWLQRVLF